MLNSKLSRTVLLSALLVVPVLAASVEPGVELFFDGVVMDQDGVAHAQGGTLVTIGAQAPTRALVGIFVAPLDLHGDPSWSEGAFVFLAETTDGGAKVQFQVPQWLSGRSYAVIAGAMYGRDLLVSPTQVLTID